MRHNQHLRILLACMLLGTALVAAGFGPGVARVARADAAPYVPTEVVVRVAAPADSSAAPDYPALMAEVNTDYGTATVRALSVAPGTFLLSTPPDEDAAITVTRMRGDPRLRFVEPNYLSGAPEASPRKISVWGGPSAAPRFEQYALTSLRIAEAQTFSRGAGVTVAVVDTGFQLDHPALAANLLPTGYDFIDGDATPEDVGDGLDDDGDGLVDEALGHGSHVAGIVLLVAPEAQILPIRALNADGIGEIYGVALAIEYAVQHGAEVINLSLGTDLETALLRDVVRSATSAGVLVVAAAGNTDSDRPEHPAADPCAVAVTAYDHQYRRAPEATFGPWVDLAAPGESIYSALYDSGYGWWSGSSMATPFVSGQAALIRAVRPDLDLRQLASLVTMTGQPLISAHAVGSQYRGVNIGLSLALANTGRRFSSRWSFIPAQCLTGAPNEGASQANEEVGLHEPSP